MAINISQVQRQIQVLGKKKKAMCAVPRKWTIVEARSPVKEAIIALWVRNDEFLKGIGHGDGAKLAE